MFLPCNKYAVDVEEFGATNHLGLSTYLMDTDHNHGCTIDGQRLTFVMHCLSFDTRLAITHA